MKKILLLFILILLFSCKDNKVIVYSEKYKDCIIDLCKKSDNNYWTYIKYDDVLIDSFSDCITDGNIERLMKFTKKVIDGNECYTASLIIKNKRYIKSLIK
jgi:hypothetical protein